MTLEIVTFVGGCIVVVAGIIFLLSIAFNSPSQPLGPADNGEPGERDSW